MKFKEGQRWRMRCPDNESDFAQIERVDGEQILVKIHQGRCHWHQWVYGGGNLYASGQSRYDLIEPLYNYELGELIK